MSDQINISAIVDYLMEYSGERYKKPDKAGEESDKMKRIHDAGVEARNQFTNLAKQVIPHFDEYEMNKCSNWVDQGQTVPDYLWIEFKLKAFKQSPSSISLFAWKHNGEVLFYIAVEARDSKCSKEDFDKHNQLLEVELSDNQLYYFAEKVNGEYYKPSNTTDELKQLVLNGELKKVRVQKNIQGPYTNENTLRMAEDIRESMKLVEPYYTKVVSGMEEKVKINVDKTNKKIGNNIILYGPPGTGKTYNTVNLAVAIIENNSIEEIRKEKYDAILQRYRNYMKSGMIAFTTFHQSYGYEEFIEGIKPHLEYDESEEESKELTYKVSSGVFKRFCNTASKVKIKDREIGLGETPAIWNVILDGTGMSQLKKYCFDNDIIKIGWHDKPEFITEETVGVNVKVRRMLLNFQDDMQIGDVVLIQKDKKNIDAIGIVTGEYEFKDDYEGYPRTRAVKWVATNIEEDVYDLNMQVQLNRYSIYPLFRMNITEVIKLIDKYVAYKSIDIQENKNNYVFIIDEINRGNISKIFGELITLIETTKRVGAPEEMVAILPYSGEVFGVPQNVYIVGTMNTADRSIALMDTALRRRFNFIEMMPDTSVLVELGIENIEGINLIKMLNNMNERIEYLYDREHTIGHAYFTDLAKEPTIVKLAEIFKNAIIPLLQEYFYEDYAKIQLVLGDNAKSDNRYKFILDKVVKSKEVFFGNVDVDLPEKQYQIQSEALLERNSYIEIYSKSGE